MTEPLDSPLPADDSLVADRAAHRRMVTVATLLMLFIAGMCLIGTVWSFALGVMVTVAAQRWDNRARPGHALPLYAYVLTTCLALAFIALLATGIALAVMAVVT